MPPASLLHADLEPVWRAVRARLDNFDTARRGRLRLPPLSEHARLALSSLLGGKVGRQIDLTTLEQSLVDRGIGGDLDTALHKLGIAASEERKSQHRTRRVRREARETVESEVASWPEDWARDWADWLFRSGKFAGTSPAAALNAVQKTRRLLDTLRGLDAPVARTEQAAALYGSAHALDDGELLERCIRRALWLQLGKVHDYAQGREIWASAGVFSDRVSAPVLGWRLPFASGSVLGDLSSSATLGGIPLHLSAFALERHPPHFAPTAPVLLVENPRLVEAAAERQTSFCVFATNGNPAGAVMRTVKAMLARGISVRHHGDFDVAGIAIVRRLHRLGCEPWRMGGDDYEHALGVAAGLGIELPIESGGCGATPWDSSLEKCFDAVARQVHEELLIDNLFDEADWMMNTPCNTTTAS